MRPLFRVVLFVLVLGLAAKDRAGNVVAGLESDVCHITKPGPSALLRCFTVWLSMVEKRDNRPLFSDAKGRF